MKPLLFTAVVFFFEFTFFIFVRVVKHYFNNNLPSV